MINTNDGKRTDKQCRHYVGIGLNKYLNINQYTYYLNSASQYTLKQYARSFEVISLIIRSNSCKTSIPCCSNHAIKIVPSLSYCEWVVCIPIWHLITKLQRAYTNTVNLWIVTARLYEEPFINISNYIIQNLIILCAIIRRETICIHTKAVTIKPNIYWIMAKKTSFKFWKIYFVTKRN